MKLLLSATAASASYKRGDRVIIKVGRGEYMLAEITAVRSGKWYLKFDDGDKGESDDIADIVGFAGPTKFDGTFKRADLKRYQAAAEPAPSVVAVPEPKAPKKPRAVRPKKTTRQPEESSGPPSAMDLMDVDIVPTLAMIGDKGKEKWVMIRGIKGNTILISGKPMQLQAIPIPNIMKIRVATKEEIMADKQEQSNNNRAERTRNKDARGTVAIKRPAGSKTSGDTTSIGF